MVSTVPILAPGCTIAGLPFGRKRANSTPCVFPFNLQAACRRAAVNAPLFVPLLLASRTSSRYGWRSPPPQKARCIRASEGANSDRIAGAEDAITEISAVMSANVGTLTDRYRRQPTKSDLQLIHFRAPAMIGSRQTGHDTRASGAADICRS